MMLLGGMQDWALRVTALIDHAGREHATREIVSRWADGSESRTNWAGVRHDALRMTQALRAVGVKPGDRIATIEGAAIATLDHRLAKAAEALGVAHILI